MVIGSANDVMGSPLPTLFAYFLGGIIAGCAGFVAGRIAASALL
jgi:hypothetical protein